LTIEKTGDLSDLDPVFLAEAGGAAYERRGAQACSATVAEEGYSLAERLEPAGLLNGVIGAQAAGGDTVNGVAVQHFTFDQRALGQQGIAKSTGEMWVASDGAYIVKYILTTEADADYFGEGIQGTLTWGYQLTDVDPEITFTLPDDCPAGMVDAPLLPDASNVLNMPSVLAYDTSTSLTDAVAFYQEQIPNLGWTLLGEPTITETLVLMDLRRNSEMTIIRPAQGTTVDILLAEYQKEPLFVGEQSLLIKANGAFV
jgi:hypothetical protein